MSFPPDYDDALQIGVAEEATNNNNALNVVPQRRRRRPLSRSSSGSRRRTSNRQRIFSRSQSAQEGTSNRGHQSSNPTEYGRYSQRLSEASGSDGPVPSIRFRIESEPSSVFTDLSPSPTSTISEELEDNAIEEEPAETVPAANQEPALESHDSPNQQDITSDNAEVALLHNTATSDTESHHSDSPAGQQRASLQPATHTSRQGTTFYL